MATQSKRGPAFLAYVFLVGCGASLASSALARSYNLSLTTFSPLFVGAAMVVAIVLWELGIRWFGKGRR